LVDTLAYLLRQKTHGFEWEIIVVDNASTDTTSTVAKSILSKSLAPEKFTIVTEENPGLIYARKKGFSVAQYKYLLFCDDDNWLGENYFQVAFDIMQQTPAVGILGGKGEAVFEKTKPVWFDTYQINFAVGEQSSQESKIVFVEAVYGAGIIVRAELFELLNTLHFESLLTGRKGNQVISGEDTELCYVTKYVGYEIAYCSNLQFKHLMPDGRMNWNYMKRLYYGFGRMRVYTHAYKLLEKTNRIPGQDLRLPFWLDKYLHLLKQWSSFLPHVVFKLNEEGNDTVLRYYALRGELKELRTLKKDYSSIFKKIIDLKKRIAMYKSITH
jgi:glycosyltransferase involved in cell wall biosynthesis